MPMTITIETSDDPRRFGESVEVNRGMNVKAFEDLDAARRWLALAGED